LSQKKNKEKQAKVNVDAAVAKTSCRCAVVAVPHDEKEEFLGCSVLTVEGLTDLTTLESMACREGISLAADLNLQRVKSSTDSLEVTKSSSELRGVCRSYS
jgi:ribonuclease HI